MKKELVREIYLGNFRPFHSAQSKTQEIDEINKAIKEICSKIMLTNDEELRSELLFEMEDYINRLVDENGLFYFKAGIKFGRDLNKEIDDESLFNI